MKKIQTIFKVWKKFKKQPSKQKILENLEKPTQENKIEKTQKKQNQKIESQSVLGKKTGRELMGRGPYHSAHGRSEQRRAHGQSIEIAGNNPYKNPFTFYYYKV
jgi:hypothetical protein